MLYGQLVTGGISTLISNNWVQSFRKCSAYSCCCCCCCCNEKAARPAARSFVQVRLYFHCYNPDTIFSSLNSSFTAVLPTFDEDITGVVDCIVVVDGAAEDDRKVGSARSSLRLSTLVETVAAIPTAAGLIDWAAWNQADDHYSINIANRSCPFHSCKLNKHKSTKYLFTIVILVPWAIDMFRICGFAYIYFSEVGHRLHTLTGSC